MLSYFENIAIGNLGYATNITLNNGSISFVPFVLPHSGSFGFLRTPISMNMISTAAAGTSVDTAFTVRRSVTQAIAVYSQGTGASSGSLMSMFSSSTGWTFINSITAGAAGSEYTVNQNVSFPGSNGDVLTISASYAVSSSNYNLSTNSLSNFTGPRFLNIPFSTSLPAGNYWLGITGQEVNSSQAGPAGLVNFRLAFSYPQASQTALTFAPLGAASNATNQFSPGLGACNNAGIGNNIALSNISLRANAPVIMFQLINRA